MQFSSNNFDLIRLLAASQVVLHHSAHSFNYSTDSWLSWILWLTKFFPGVPLFFFTSGYLISRSFENNPNIKEYGFNRFLRLYPGLWISIAVTYMLITLSGYFKVNDVSLLEHTIMLASKASVFQFYNPDFLRNYGDGVFNGNLWTISVELQFYILTPIIYLLLKKVSTNTKIEVPVLITLLILFLVANYSYIRMDGTLLSTKLFRASFAPWFYMFITGILFQKYFRYLHKLFAGRFLLLLAAYIPFCQVLVANFSVDLGNTVNPIIFFAMCIVVFSGAYSLPNLANKLLKRNDISYGVYIYHMPIANYLQYGNFLSPGTQIFVGLFVTYVLAVISWLCLEKPCLKLKKHPLLNAK